MEVEGAIIPDVRLLKVRYFTHHRGYFVETYNKRVARDLGLTCCFVQDDLLLSIKRGTVRALHFPIPPKAQAKLVHVVSGSIF
jgi:dTDP-4-dehydrorhamnose 3,5-epimerase